MIEEAPAQLTVSLTSCPSPVLYAERGAHYRYECWKNVISGSHGAPTEMEVAICYVSIAAFGIIKTQERRFWFIYYFLRSAVDGAGCTKHTFRGK